MAVLMPLMSPAGMVTLSMPAMMMLAMSVTVSPPVPAVGPYGACERNGCEDHDRSE
jgi:hypothetical protein